MRFSSLNRGLIGEHKTKPVTGGVTPAVLFNRASGLKIAGIGDSITAHHRAEAVGQPTFISGQGWLFWAMLASGGRLRYHGIYATGGLTAAQVLATDVPLLQAATIRPDICTVLVGTNDLVALSNVSSWTGSLAAGFTAVQSIVAAVQALNIQPVLCTIPGFGSGVQAAQLLTRWNSWIRRYADISGIPLLDFQSVVADPASISAFRAGYSEGDNIHPSSLGAQKMGQYVSDQLGVGSLPYTPTLPMWNTETNVNKITNPLMLTNASPGPWPDGWTQQSTTGETNTLITTDTAIVGNWWRIQQTLAGTSQYYQPISVTAGQRFRLSGRLKINAMTTAAAGCSVEIECFTDNGLKLFDEDGMAVGQYWIDTGPGAGQQIGVASGPFTSREGVVPGGATQVFVRININAPTVDVQFAQFCVELFNSDGTI